MHLHTTCFYVSLGIFISRSSVVSFLPNSFQFLCFLFPCNISAANLDIYLDPISKLIITMLKSCLSMVSSFGCIETEFKVQYFWLWGKTVIAVQFCRNLTLLLEINAFHYLKIMTFRDNNKGFTQKKFWRNLSFSSLYFSVLLASSVRIANN